MSVLAGVVPDRELARMRLMDPECFRLRHMVTPERSTYEPVDASVTRALETGNLADLPHARMMQLYERLRFSEGGSELAKTIDTFLIRRDEQQQKLEGLNVNALLELISQGHLPAELSEKLGVSHQVIHAYLLRAAHDDADVEHALQLCADMQAYRGLDDIAGASEQSKAGVQKAVELAKHRMTIARALNPKRYGEKLPPIPVGAIGGGGATGGGAWLILDVTSNLPEGGAQRAMPRDPSVVSEQSGAGQGAPPDPVHAPASADPAPPHALDYIFQDTP